MPVRGTKPKPEGQRRRRNTPTHEWTEVENVPYEGDVPVELPDGITKRAAKWWSVISRMPHCVLWGASDWQFAEDSILIADAFYRDPLKGEAAHRAREKIMGTTVDFRRDLRVRYVDPAEVVPAEVASIDDYRRAASDHFATDDDA